MDSAATFKKAKKEILDRINSWSDLYDYFDEARAVVCSTMHPYAVMDSLFTMHAFFIAMREMPDEGDIKKLVSRMMDILYFESEEKLGTQILIMSEDDMNDVASGGSSAKFMAEQMKPAGSIH